MAKKFKADTPGATAPGVTADDERRYFDAAEGNHKETMTALELGGIGKVIGGPSQSAHSIAFIVIVLAFLILIVCMAAEADAPSDGAFWSKLATAMIGIIGTAVGFLFGRSTKSPQ